jgi:hypothetical protein
MDIKKIVFPSVDSIAIFDFIDIVRKQSKNNAIKPFNDFSDIEKYIKNQFAGLFSLYLSKAIEEKKNSENIGLLLNENDKQEIISSQLLKITGSDKSEVLVKKNIKYSKGQRYNLSKTPNGKEQASASLTNLTETKFYSDTWINPLTDLCLSFLEFLQKKPGGQYICFKETLIGTEEEPGEIIKEYHRTAILLKKELFVKYLDHHKIAALYIRSFLKYCPFYIGVPDNIKNQELYLYTSLSNEYFSILLLDTIFKAFNGSLNKTLIIDERYKLNFVKLLYHYKRDIDKLDLLTFSNIINLIEQLYFMNGD